ncbi:hypothetical protein [Hymenobacter sp. UYCo722]|uniref:hypothetical protein n=1 Tax=Hymenobacter sp. UYCo722 TaxID=3156335 RepID=UPI003398BE3C
MKNPLLQFVTSLFLLLASVSPTTAQWFHRIGHVSKSQTKKSEHSNKGVKHSAKHKTKKRNPDHDERRRRKEAKRQEKRRAEGPRLLPAATPEPEKTAP